MRLILLGIFSDYFPVIVLLGYVLVTILMGYILWLCIKALRKYLKEPPKD